MGLCQSLGCLGGGSSGRLPSKAELDALDGLFSRSQTAFDPDATPAHLKLLEDLWYTFHDNVRGAKRPFERVSSEWLKIGFQNADPASDIRGGGVLAVENMLRFIQSAPDAAIAMAESGEDGEIDVLTATYMPWAAAGVTVTRTLLEIFGALSRAGGRRDASGDRLPFWPLVFEFDALYALSFELLDATFDDEHGTYMSFPHVKATVIRRLEFALREKRVAHVDDLPAVLHFSYHAKQLPAEELAKAKAARAEAVRKSALAVRAAVRLGTPSRHPPILREGFGIPPKAEEEAPEEEKPEARSPLHATALGGLFRRGSRTSTIGSLDRDAASN